MYQDNFERVLPDTERYLLTELSVRRKEWIQKEQKLRKQRVIAWALVQVILLLVALALALGLLLTMTEKVGKTFLLPVSPRPSVTLSPQGD